ALGGPPAQRIAAAVLESRLGGGSRRSSFFPGNVRKVTDHPAENVVVRREDYDAGIPPEELVAWLTSRGRQVIYTPDTSVSAAPAPLLRPHLDDALRHARARGMAARRTRARSLSRATALSLTPLLAAIVGLALLGVGGGARVV